MIDANTFFVGHIDLARLDPELAAANLKTQLADVLTKLRSNKALAESLDDEGLVEALRMSMRGLDIGTMLVQSKLDELRSLGCNEIYLTANSKIMTVSAVQVVCLAPARNLAKLEQTLLLPEQAEFGWVFQHDGDKLIANLIAPFSTTSLDDANVGNRVAFQHRLIRPAVRPELAAGLDRIKNAPVKLVFAPDGVIRRFLQSWPMMASSMMFQDNPGMMMFFAGANTSTKFVDDSIRWMAIGLDPARPVLAMTIQSKTPEAAQDLHDMVVSAKVALSVSMADQHVNRRYNSYGYNNNLEQFSAALDFAMLFLPVVQGDRLQLVIDEKRLADTTELITNAYTNVVLPSRESSHKMQCANNMKQIMLALHNYHDANRVFPTAYRVNEDGKPLHSWRVALLPYIEQTALYDRMVPYMNEPWDSENNKQFHNVNVPQYQCPAAKNAPGMTNYSVVVGRADEEQARELGLLAPSSTAFPEPNKWVSLAHMSDGTSNTIAVVERKEPVCWMDPSNEITLEEAIKLYNLEQSKVGSAHKGGFNIGICDGSVQFWDLTNPRYYIDLWKAGLTANGGESGRLWLY
ncbi:MAG: DUF1559 domain-containing protein [Planctomycetaceae bacterium]|nr:DUF1559 domain-containing protein [Planctomycetaceae bacterium]